MEGCLFDVQRVELEILRKVTDVLEKYNLRYVLYFGSLLGAVRHRGFIPWDDDIDIVIPRDDYEKFKVVAKDELPSNYFVQDVYTDDEYPSLTAKVRNSDTTLIERGYVNLKKMNHGIFIDIFIADKYNEKRNNKLTLFKIKIYKNLLLCQKVKGSSKIKKLISKFFSRKWLIKAIENNQKKVAKNSNGENYIIENKNVLNRDVFENSKKVPFESIEAKIPVNFHKYLTKEYGNYMQLPPIDKRVPMHGHNHIRIDKGYKEYIEEYLNVS